MLASIAMLKDISLRCRRAEPLTLDQAQWLGQSLENFLSQRCSSLREAFGIKFAQGGVPWWREQSMRERDAALRRLAEEFCQDASVTARARYVATLAKRYAASAWRFDRSRETAPAHYAGTPRSYLWQAFKSGAPMPLAERRLRSLLSD